MATTRYTLHPRRHWSSGAMVCLVLFALGGLLLWGLFRAPRATAPAVPDVPWAVPPRAIRVVCLDAGQWAGSLDRLPAFLAPLDADFVLVQRLPRRAVVPLAEGLGMQRSYHPSNFARVGDDATGGGCLVLSRHPLYGATPLRPDVRRRSAAGIWATTVVEGSGFAVASVDGGPGLMAGGGVPALVAARLLDERQRAAQDPPLLAGIRAPQMLSARTQLLAKSRLEGVEYSGAAGGQGPAPEPLVAFTGPWRGLSAPKEVAPGIVFVEVGPQ